MNLGFTKQTSAAIPIVLVDKTDLDAVRDSQTKAHQTWMDNTGFKATVGEVCLLPDAQGQLVKVLVGLDQTNMIKSIGDLPQKLPINNYCFEGNHQALALAYLAWGMGCYQFRTYKTDEAKNYASLQLPEQQSDITAILQAIYLARDLINTPAEALGPEALAAAIVKVGEQYNASVKQVIGDDLIKQNYPAVHAVGRASAQAPRFVELTWGDPNHPKLALVGKGVCFDTGGLDIKTRGGMLLMKKDMGGAAHALALAQLVMQAQLPVYLHLCIPAVENAVAGNALRPSDVIETRLGKTVEVLNTDAEGRLVVADGLARVSEQPCDLIIDFTTLTGAARVALGADLPAMFCNDDEVSADIMAAGELLQDPVWRMPLHQHYRQQLDSKVADIANCTNSGLAGAITAALFLETFIAENTPWVHFDLMAWNPSNKPGRPEGGEAMALRAVFQFLLNKFTSK